MRGARPFRVQGDRPARALRPYAVPACWRGAILVDPGPTHLLLVRAPAAADRDRRWLDEARLGARTHGARRMGERVPEPGQGRTGGHPSQLSQRTPLVRR